MRFLDKLSVAIILIWFPLIAFASTEDDLKAAAERCMPDIYYGVEIGEGVDTGTNYSPYEKSEFCMRIYADIIATDFSDFNMQHVRSVLIEDTKNGEFEPTAIPADANCSVSGFANVEEATRHFITSKRSGAVEDGVDFSRPEAACFFAVPLYVDGRQCMSTKTRKEIKEIIDDAQCPFPIPE